MAWYFFSCIIKLNWKDETTLCWTCAFLYLARPAGTCMISLDKGFISSGWVVLTSFTEFVGHASSEWEVLSLLCNYIHRDSCKQWGMNLQHFHPHPPPWWKCIGSLIENFLFLGEKHSNPWHVTVHKKLTKPATFLQLINSGIFAEYFY